jgi:hypothetical protein
MCEFAEFYMLKRGTGRRRPVQVYTQSAAISGVGLSADLGDHLEDGVRDAALEFRSVDFLDAFHTIEDPAVPAFVPAFAGDLGSGGDHGGRRRKFPHDEQDGANCRNHETPPPKEVALVPVSLHTSYVEIRGGFPVPYGIT